MPELAPLIAIVGADGSGKTTVSAAVMGFVRRYGQAETAHLGLRSGDLGRAIQRLPLVGAVLDSRKMAKHFALEIRDGHIYLADPAQGKISFTTSEFLKFWDGNVLFLIYPKDGVDINNRLELTDNDLRVMDEDRIRQSVLATLPAFGLPLDRKVDKAAGGTVYYKHK